MDVAIRNKGTYAFAPFRLDPVRRVLLRNGAPVLLPPRLFDTLLYLVENAGEVVERDELLRVVWGGRVVEDANINQTIFALRKALQTDGTADRLIVTVPTRGYRFVAPVWFEADPVEAFTPATHAAAETPMPVAPHRALGAAPLPWRGSLAVSVAVLSSIVVAFAAFVWLLLQTSARVNADVTPPFVPPPHSVAVLAFTNMSGDPTQDYFSDGISEELINALSRIGSLRVAARTSAFSFKGKSATIATISRQLNVGKVLEGSVRREGSQVRITAELINAATGFELWSRSYDRDQGDLLNLQGEIAEAIMQSLQITLLGDDRARLALGGTKDPRAFDAYLRGMKLGRGLEASSDKAAIAAFSEALVIDPGYTLARAQLSRALISEALRDAGLDPEHFKSQTTKGIDEARIAISMSPLLGEAHLAMAFALDNGTNDWAGAGAEWARAAELAPGNATIVIGKDFHALLAPGDKSSRIAALEQAVELDPLSPEAYRAVANASVIVRRYDDALAARHHEEQLEPAESTLDELFIGSVDVMKGDPNSALRTCARARDAWENWCLALAYAALRRPSDSLAQMAKMKAIIHEDGDAGYVEVYAQLGQIAEAVSWFQFAYRNHSIDRSFFLDPLLDPIRSTPEYKDIERRLDFRP